MLTGGPGGVMEAALRGARASKRYQSGDTIAVMPTYRSSDASDAADIVICTGMNHARNAIVVASAAVVLAIGDRSGTLGELAVAWELGRPIGCVGGGGSEGWANQLAGMGLEWSELAEAGVRASGHDLGLLLGNVLAQREPLRLCRFLVPEDPRWVERVLVPAMGGAA